MNENEGFILRLAENLYALPISRSQFVDLLEETNWVGVQLFITQHQQPMIRLTCSNYHMEGQWDQYISVIVIDNAERDMLGDITMDNLEGCGLVNKIVTYEPILS